MDRYRRRQTIRTDRATAWCALLVAAVFEVVFALGTAASEGFSKLTASMITVAAAAGAIFFLSFALKTLEVGIGYTVWTGIGSAGTVVFGALLLGQSVTLLKGIYFVAIVGGVIGLKLTSADPAPHPGQSSAESA
ncbi:DMT family transporter [Streptomyces sp. NPDC057717]|uniref:DMT family transporter n=1 Tax=Streptomyces sp. NPDC057717 TaxID=3346224 RepID=UPI0036A9D1F8